jgi:hemolysin III
MSGPPEKPRLRGVFHQIAFFVFGAVNVGLYLSVEGERAKQAMLVYAASIAFLYGVSALYHRVDWSPSARQRMRSLDHSAIFVMIWGSYSPLFLLLVPEGYDGRPMLWTTIFAGLGVAKSLLWAHAPKALTALLAIAVGWSAVLHAIRLAPVMGHPSVELLFGSGIVYTLGAVVYALKRPDPFPRTFGYHEVFHLFVIAGSLVHYGHTLLVLEKAGALSW